MNMIIPSIILFTALFLGLAMIPYIIKDSIPDVKAVLQEAFQEERTDEE